MAGRTDDGNGAANAIADSNMTLKLLRDKRFITTSEITYLDAGRIATVTRVLTIVAEHLGAGIVAKVPGGPMIEFASGAKAPSHSEDIRGAKAPLFHRWRPRAR